MGCRSADFYAKRDVGGVLRRDKLCDAAFSGFGNRGAKNVVRYMQIISQAGVWILLTTIVVLSLLPPQDRPVTSLPHLVEHLSIFLATGLVFGVGYPQRRLFQFVTLLAFTAAIELAQLLVPGRHARLSDFLIDALGMTVGLWIGFMAVPGTRSGVRARLEKASVGIQRY